MKGGAVGWVKSKANRAARLLTVHGTQMVCSRNYGELLHQDIQLRTYLMDRLKQAAISRVVIERPAGRARVTIHAGRPGLIIGKKGQDIESCAQICLHVLVVK